MNSCFKNTISAILLLTATPACASPQLRPADGIESGVSALKILKTALGTIGYEDSGTGSEAIVCIPGMGDTRGQFRLLAPLLVKAGYRVIVVDPRGQGDSDATFDGYSASLVGEDVVRLIDELKVDPTLVGNSSGGASAAWAAMQRPGHIKGLVLLDGFLRDHPAGFLRNLGLHLALVGPWGPASWISYYKSLFTGVTPVDQDKYTQNLERSLKQKHHMGALRAMIFASKSDVAARLAEIRVPVLAIAGSKDPDFKNPEEELDWILSSMQSARPEKDIVPNAGHYPHLEYPELVAGRILRFLMPQQQH